MPTRRVDLATQDRSKDIVEVYRRADRKLDWRRKDPEGRVLCDSANQGYNHMHDCWVMARALCSDLPEERFVDVAGHHIPHADPVVVGEALVSALSGNGDARAWARGFAQTMRSVPEANPEDEEWLTTWFANALETGRDLQSGKAKATSSAQG